MAFEVGVTSLASNTWNSGGNLTFLSGVMLPWWRRKMDDVLSVLKFGWQESGQFFCFSTVAGEWTVFLLFNGSLIDSKEC